MLDAIYSANSGLQSFSKGLSVISDNVTNINTVGYKATNLLYRNIHYNFTLRDNGRDSLHGTQIGAGVAADTTSLFFTEGDLRSTGNDSDVAIDGKGFFIIEKEGEHVYSRNGQFIFDDAGDLVTRDGGLKVLGLVGGKLQTINENQYKAIPAVPTSVIHFTGNLAPTAPNASVNNILVVDAAGGSHRFTATFTRDTTGNGRSWKVAVTDENNRPVGQVGTIGFQDNGSPAPDANTCVFSYQAQGAAAQQITFDFGTPGSFHSTTAFSDAAAGDQDGRVAGSLLSLSFSDKGVLTVKYSNQQTQTGPQLALAKFGDVESLIQLGGGLFAPQNGQVPTIGTAGSDVFGRIAGGKLEGSNVDLTQQFSDMIVIQRGYQASSQVLTTANEMMQQLLEVSKK